MKGAKRYLQFIVESGKKTVQRHFGWFFSNFVRRTN